MYHGSRGWIGAPEIRASKALRAERGPGINATTHYERAKQYAKGGGSVRRITFSPRLLLENACLSLNDAISFAEATAPLSKQEDIIQRMTKRSSRVPAQGKVLLGTDTQHIPAEVLLTLFVNLDLSSGARGIALAKYLSSQGIDASFSVESGNEYWGIIFNPECIVSYGIYQVDKSTRIEYELPSPYEQLARNASPTHTPEDPSP